MKLRLKVLLISLAVTIFLGAMLTVVIEYSMSLETKNEILLAEREAEAKRKEQESIEAEKQYKESEFAKALDKYDSVEEYYLGVALVKKDDKYGYIDNNGNEVIPLQYELASNFTNKYVKVKKDGKWGYINKEGTEVVPIEYSYCGEVSCDIVAVGNGGKYGFISMDGSEVCGLIYDKVEAFNESTNMAKVILNGKFGFIDRSGKEMVPIEAEYKEENMDFTGEWKATNVHSSKAGVIRISEQVATSFNFEISAKYFAKSGTIKGTADIIKANTAQYEYNSGELSDTLTFTIIDGELNITAKNGGNCGMDKEVSAIGSYTLDVPKYTNDKVMTKLFEDDEKLFTKIKDTLGEEVYGEYFLYGFKNGEYSVKELDDAAYFIKGTLYTVTVPTLEKDFKLLLSGDYIYFFAKAEEIYKTNDEGRTSLARMPSSIAFDEL